MRHSCSIMAHRVAKFLLSLVARSQPDLCGKVLGKQRLRKLKQPSRRDDLASFEMSVGFEQNLLPVLVTQAQELSQIGSAGKPFLKSFRTDRTLHGGVPRNGLRALPIAAADAHRSRGCLAKLVR